MGYKGTLAAVDRIREEFDAKVMGWKEELKVKLKSIKSNLRELIAETGLVMFKRKNLRQMKKNYGPSEIEYWTFDLKMNRLPHWKTKQHLFYASSNLANFRPVWPWNL